MTTRRRFLGGILGVAGASAFPQIVPSSALGREGRVAPSGRVRIGVIGCGNRSPHVVTGLMKHPACEIVALCDPFKDRFASWRASKAFETAPRPEGLREYSDFRELIASDVDAALIATGDHWHVPIALLAARAGKHIFLEKPLGLSIEQCLACREISQEYKVVVQYGAQNRSNLYVRGGIELALNGHIGEVRDIYMFCPPGMSGGSATPELPVPPGFDYEMWLGPAPYKPFSYDRCLLRGIRNGIFHIYDYALGFLAGWGAHVMDQLQWWLDESGLGIPQHVEATGEIPTEGLFDTLVHWDALLTYSGGPKVRFCDAETILKHLPKLEGHEQTAESKLSTLFVGSEGWIDFGRAGWSASSREILLKHRNPGPKRLINAQGSHFENFIDAILGKNRAVSSIDSAIRSDIACHMVDLAVRTGKPVGWDATKNTITDNPEAAKLMHRPMRAPWDVLNPKYSGRPA